MKIPLKTSIGSTRYLVGQYMAKKDWTNVSALLRDHITYQDVSKEHFLNCLSEAVDSLSNYGFDELELIEGKCNGCYAGCFGYTILNPETRNYIDLVFEGDEELIADIYECTLFENEEDLSKGERFNIFPF